MVNVVLNDDTSLYTIVYPNKGKESVIFLHGGPTVPEDMTLIANFLSKDFQVIDFHQRGTLKSPCPSGNFSLESYCSDIDCIASYYSLEKFHLFGHSWGGLYASVFAEIRPDKILSMFLCSPASGTGKQWIKMGMEISSYNRKRCALPELIGMSINSLLGLSGSTNAYKRLYKQFGFNCNKGFGVKGAFPFYIDYVKAQPVNRTNWSILSYHKLKRLTDAGFKISVTYGDDDLYGSSANYVRERYPTATFYTIQNCGHIHWRHNEAMFLTILSKHFNLSSPI